MVTIYFATNRNPIGDPPRGFGKNLGPVDGENIRLGRARVDLQKNKMVALRVEPEKLVSNRRDPTDLKFGSDAIFERLRKDMDKRKRDTILYVHGYANTFADSVVRTAQIQKFLLNKVNVFLFSWPSDGEVLLYDPYFRDRADAKSSGEALARGILILARYLKRIDSRAYCDQCVHLMAHSMGNFALSHGMRALKERFAGRHVKIIDKAFLMAADVDHDALSHPDKLEFLPKIASEVCVYHTPRDLALTISDVTKGNPERLGDDGPANARALPDKVSVIDVSDVVDADSDLTNHQYYRLNPLVRDDVLAVLEGTRPMEIPGREYDAHGRRFRLLPDDGESEDEDFVDS